MQENSREHPAETSVHAAADATGLTSQKRHSALHTLKVIWHRSPLLLTQIGAFLIFLIWVGFFPLDVASYAQGQVIPAGQIKKVQHLEGGIIRAILVQEGQFVKQGEVIAELEDISSNSDVSDIKSHAASLEVRVARLTATLAHQSSFSVSAPLEREYKDIVRDAKSAFASYRERYKAMVDTKESRIAQRRAEIVETRERLAGLQARFKLITDQVRISEEMLKQKLNSEYEHLQLLKEKSQIESDRNTTIATQQKAATALEEEISALQAFRKEEDVNLRKELLDANTELNSLREKLKKPADSFERTQVRAPVSGNIMTLYFKNKGSVVSPGGIIATLVPEGEELIIEAKLPISEVGFVRQGEVGRLSLPTGASGFTTIESEVIHISPDSVLDEKTGVSYFVVRLRPHKFAFARNDEVYPLKPGVQVTAAIITGQRSVLTVLLQPFLGNGIKPLTER